MDRYDNNSTHHQYRRRDHRHPSFSSTLLDQIYRSTDDSSDVSMRKKQNSLDENRVSLERILVHRRKTADDFVKSKNPNTVEPIIFKHSSSSSSSDSSGLSSSESDSFYSRTRSSRSPPEIRHPKPIRTSTVVERPKNNKQEQHGSFLKTKSKALKMYSDLKQPISPGGRVATFLNSLFTGNTKKPNKIKTATSSTATSSTACSSASSFSRSCLSSKTTSSSSEKSKRSVRFFLDDDDGSKQRDSVRRHLEIRVMEENRRVIEAAKELLRTYQKNKDEEEDDAASCASSDLFELDNLSAIGIDRYREELPVYETTRLNTNRYHLQMN